jgi:hypothetical protein
MHGVSDVDTALRIFDDGMRIPVAKSGGQFTPIVDYLIGVLAGADHRALQARFVGRSEKSRGCRKQGSSLHPHSIHQTAK